MDLLAAKGEIVTVTCRRCDQAFSYAYPGQGPLRQRHHGDEEGAGADCRRLYDNKERRKAKLAMAGVKKFLASKNSSKEAALRELLGFDFDYIVTERTAAQIRLVNRTTNTSRTQTVMISESGFLLDLSRPDRRELLERLASVQVATQALLGETHAKRQAHVTLAVYREAVTKQILPLLEDLTNLIRYGR